MLDYKARKVVDEEAQFPFRYKVLKPDTGDVVGVFDIKRLESPGDIKGTSINADWLQPIENFLESIGVDLNAIEQEVAETNLNLSTVEADVNNRISAARLNFISQIDISDNEIAKVDRRIDTANAGMNNLNATIATLAPLNNPILTNPMANNVAITTNNTSLATTASVKKYLDDLFAAYKG